ncbi:MAG: RNA polymerase sigma factor [Acidobacteria bacterium]|nr:RNA polymerase sigma factor [Acidobacteriota bacterium]
MNNPPPAYALAMNEETFQVFYEQTAQGIWRYVFVTCRNEAITDDVVQDSYIRFLRYVDCSRSFPEQRAYLYRIAGTMLISHFRGNQLGRTGVKEEDEWPGKPERDRNLVLDVQTVLGDVEPRQRKLLWLAHVDGFSHNEIADILGVAEQSVKVMLHRARKKLKSLLKKRGLNQEVMF